jgi:Methyltransferase FkbM domain
MVKLTRNNDNNSTGSWCRSLPQLLLGCAGGLFIGVSYMSISNNGSQNSTLTSSSSHDEFLISVLQKQKVPTANAISTSASESNESIIANTPGHIRGVADSSTNTNRYIYIDLGANCGKTYWRAKYGKGPNTDITLKVPSPSLWESYLWECNPTLVELYLNDIASTEIGVTIIPKAAWSYTGTALLHVPISYVNATEKHHLEHSECDIETDNHPAGLSTFYKTAAAAATERDSNDDNTNVDESTITTIEVPTLDFVEWHKSLNLQEGDVVHIKLDIEGSERDILEKMILQESHDICHWDVVWIEYHKTLFEYDTIDEKTHRWFEKDFPKMFQIKCNRPLVPNAAL